jgi:hypothetical protein
VDAAVLGADEIEVTTNRDVNSAPPFLLVRSTLVRSV